MTPEIKKLSDEELRIKVAELLGYPDNWMRLYDWPRDLNACNEMEMALKGAAFYRYYAVLAQVCLDNRVPHYASAPARQRCEAFVATLNMETK